jgi:hypothetical protein
MTISDSYPRGMSQASEPAVPRPAAEPAAASWPWRRAGLLLSAAAQLITISAVVGVDAPPLTWATLLLAVAPVLLAGLAAVVPARVALVVTVTVAVLVAGIASAVTHPGLLFVPALAAFAGTAVVLWRGQP